MKVCVVGIGYIGLPTACILASKDFQIIGVDIDSNYIDKLNSGNFDFVEDGLNDLIKKSLANKNLILKLAPEKADVFILCVPTPLTQDNKPDLSYLKSALHSILSFIKKGNLIIVESTIPPGTIDDFVKPILEKTNFLIGKDIFLGHCPERVAPQNIIYELINNNRIIGGCTENCGKNIGEFYGRFVKGEINITTSKVAEMVKLVENAYRDVNIALSNEIAIICNELNINPYEVIALANKHPRVNLLDFGIGVGGHCLPIDSHFIIDKVPSKSKLLSTSRLINDNMPIYIVEKIQKLLLGLDNPKIALWGLSYKPNTQDIRNSPSIEIIRLLQDRGYNLSVYDPYVEGKSVEQKYHSVSNADILLLLVEHQAFLDEDFDLLIREMNSPIIFDIRKIINPEKLKSSAFIYNLENI